MTEQEQVQVTQADRDAAEALRGSPAYALGFYDHTPLVQAFARHRIEATAEALEAMREAWEALDAATRSTNGDREVNEEKGIYLAHSYSSMKMFENCPQRYYRQRILKDIKDEGGEASMYGERIHEMLEHRLRDNTELPKGDEA